MWFDWLRQAGDRLGVIIRECKEELSEGSGCVYCDCDVTYTYIIYIYILYLPPQLSTVNTIDWRNNFGKA